MLDLHLHITALMRLVPRIAEDPAFIEVLPLCSFRGDPFSRPRWASRMGALSWGLDLANFEGVPVRLRGFEMENISMLWSAFIAQIMRQIRVTPHSFLCTSTAIPLSCHGLSSTGGAM